MTYAGLVFGSLCCWSCCVRRWRQTETHRQLFTFECLCLDKGERKGEAVGVGARCNWLGSGSRNSLERDSWCRCGTGCAVVLGQTAPLCLAKEAGCSRVKFGHKGGALAKVLKFGKFVGACRYRCCGGCGGGSAIVLCGGGSRGTCVSRGRAWLFVG